MRKLLLLALFLCVHWAARGQATFDYKYWFDGNDSQAQLFTSANEHWQEEIDVSQLDYMLHTFHFQAKDEKEYGVRHTLPTSSSRQTKRKDSSTIGLMITTKPNKLFREEMP